MKRVLCILAVAMVVCCLFTACTLSTGFGKSQTQPKVEEMMLALAEGDDAAAQALLHPDVDENAEEQLALIKEYLAGRQISSLEQQNVSVNKSVGTGGTVLREEVTYQATLDDNTEIYILASYLDDDNGEGFTAFRIAIGVA